MSDAPMTSNATTRRRVLAAAATLGVVLLLCGPGVSAQQKPASQGNAPPNALQGFSQNRDEPVKIQAATLEVRDKDRIATFSGDVRVLQGDTEMRCKSLVVFYDEASSGAKSLKAAEPGPAGQQQIRRIEAKGGVTVIQKDQKAQGDTGIFDMRANTVTLTGNVVVVQGQSVLSGHRLVVDLTTGTSKIDGATRDGRVEALIPRSGANPEKK
jgi:lipopolysaccharide export system protein LptA